MPVSQIPLRVVIAEDEALIRLDFKEMLEEEGYEVTGEATDGEKVVELASPGHPEARPGHPGQHLPNIEKASGQEELILASPYQW